MTAVLADGWLIVGPVEDRSPLYLGARFNGVPTEWRAAFADWHGGQRVVKVRPWEGLAPGVTVWLRKDGQTLRVGTI